MTERNTIQEMEDGDSDNLDEQEPASDTDSLPSPTYVPLSSLLNLPPTEHATEDAGEDSDSRETEDSDTSETDEPKEDEVINFYYGILLNC